MSTLKTIDLTKRYGNNRGVRDISLDIEQGEIFGFIGPNGAGKSTTIRMIMQLALPTSGTIELFGKKVYGEIPQMRRKIGYLPSEIHLYDDMTGRDILEFAARSYSLELKRTKAADIADRLQFDMNRRVKSYSLGNRKKLGIVLALLHDPELLILDEPTSGLDPLIQHAFFELLKEWNAKGATIFFSTHILSEVEKICGRVAIIREGELIRTGHVSDLIGGSERKYTVQFMGEGNLIDRYELKALDPNAVYADGVHVFTSRLSIHETLARISKYEIRDLTIGKPSLEQLFMKYYEPKDGEAL